MAEDESGTGAAPAGPPTEWPGAPPVAPEAATPPHRRRRWPWALAAGAVGVVAVGAVGAVTLLGDDADGDEAYCALLDGPGRTDVPMVVFLEPAASAAEIDSVEELLERSEDVTRLDYVDRDEAFAEAEQMFADRPDVVAQLRREDIPTSFRFVVPNPVAAVDVERQARSVAAVEDVRRPESSEDTVLELVQAVADEDSAPDVGRFGTAIDAERAERLRSAAPDAVVDEVGVVVDGIIGGAPVEDAHRDAADAVVSDAVERCR